MTILDGFMIVFQAQNILLLVGGVVLGIVVGVIPGLTASLAISLLLPVTFGVPAVASLNMLIGIYIGGCYGGSITAILIRTPGTPGAAATVMDGYPMAQKGEAGRAIGIATFCSSMGGLISCTFLIFLSPTLSRFALRFSSAEYFALALFGLTVVFSVSGKSLLKGAIAGCLGLLINTVGMDPLVGVQRFTFGIRNLMIGFPLLPTIIGIFAIPEAIRLFEGKKSETVAATTEVGRIIPRLADIIALKWTILKSSIIGVFIGTLPGPGANVAGFVSYAEARRTSKHPELFGTGIIEGVAAPETANSAVSGGNLIPTLSLGVPGDGVMAILLGAFTIQGLTPGPMLFRDRPDIIYSIFSGAIVSHLIVLIAGLFLAFFLVRISTVSKITLAPIIAIMAMIGSYAAESSIAHMTITVVFGVVSYFLEKMSFPMPPVVLAIVLGTLAENNFRIALIRSRGDWGIFVHSPIAVFFLSVAVFSIALSLYRAYKASRNTKTT